MVINKIGTRIFLFFVLLLLTTKQTSFGNYIEEQVVAVVDVRQVHELALQIEAISHRDIDHMDEDGLIALLAVLKRDLLGRFSAIAFGRVDIYRNSQALQVVGAAWRRCRDAIEGRLFVLNEVHEEFAFNNEDEFPIPRPIRLMRQFAMGPVEFAVAYPR